MGNQCGATPSDPYHVNLCMLSYSIKDCIATNTYLDTLQQWLKSQLDFALKFQLAMPPARHSLMSLLF